MSTDESTKHRLRRKIFIIIPRVFIGHLLYYCIVKQICSILNSIETNIITNTTVHFVDLDQMGHKKAPLSQKKDLF
jgi:hypothetical protein